MVTLPFAVLSCATLLHKDIKNELTWTICLCFLFLYANPTLLRVSFFCTCAIFVDAHTHIDAKKTFFFFVSQHKAERICLHGIHC